MNKLKIKLLLAALFVLPSFAFADPAAVLDKDGRARFLALDGYPLLLGAEDSADGGIQFYVEDAVQCTIKDGVVAPVTDNDVDLGTSSLEFKDAYFDGVVKTDGLQVDVSDITATASGVTLALQEATAGAACSGTLTANGATPVVTSTTCATTGSRIFLSRTSAETGVVQAWVSALSTGVSFSVTGEAGDTGTYNWVIFHESP